MNKTLYKAQTQHPYTPVKTGNKKKIYLCKFDFVIAVLPLRWAARLSVLVDLLLGSPNFTEISAV
jgi:hypothetical protein